MTNPRIHRTVTLVAFAALGCSKDPKPTLSADKPHPSVAPPAPSAPAANLEPKTPPPSPFAPPDPLPPAVEAKVAPDKLETHFVLAEDPKFAGCDFVVHSLKGALFATCGGSLFRFDKGKLVEIHYDMTNETGITEFQTLSGSWPGGLSGFAVTSTALHYERGDTWVDGDCVVTGTFDALHCNLTAIAPPAPWRGRTLVLGKNGFEILVGKKDLSVPRIATGAKPPEPRYRASTFASTADGRVIAAGISLTNEGYAEAQTWNADDVEGTVQVLPDEHVASDVLFHVLLGSKKFAYILARGHEYGVVFRSEGGRPFEKVTIPFIPDPRKAAVEAGTKLWAVDRGPQPSVYRLEGSTWTKVVVPDEAALRRALGDPESKDPLRLQPTSVAVYEGKVYIGATIYAGNDRQWGRAILEPGPAPSRVASDAGAAAPAKPVASAAN